MKGNNKKINDKGTYYKKQNKNYRQKYQIGENVFLPFMFG